MTEYQLTEGAKVLEQAQTLKKDLDELLASPIPNHLGQTLIWKDIMDVSGYLNDRLLKDVLVAGRSAMIDTLQTSLADLEWPTKEAVE